MMIWKTKRKKLKKNLNVSRKNTMLFQNNSQLQNLLLQHLFNLLLSSGMNSHLSIILM